MAMQEIDRGEIVKPRYAFIVVIGGIGTGKTELKNALVADLPQGSKLEVLGEPFGKVRDLPRFYFGNPRKYSYSVQTGFLNIKAPFLEAVSGMLAERTVLEDQPLEGDYQIAKTQWQMRMMTDKQWLSYKSLFKRLTLEVPTPNLYIYTRVKDRNIIEKRIIERARSTRGRSMEIAMLKNKEYPGYYLNVFDKFEQWFEENNGLKPIVQVDTDDFDIVSDPRARERVVADVYARAGYHIAKSDGKLILPPFLRPPARSYAQQSAESLRFNGT